MRRGEKVDREPGYFRAPRGRSAQRKLLWEPVLEATEKEKVQTHAKLDKRELLVLAMTKGKRSAEGGNSCLS